MKEKNLSFYFLVEVTKFLPDFAAKDLLFERTGIVRRTFIPVERRHALCLFSRKQNAFFQANRQCSLFTLYLGKYFTKDIKCNYYHNIIHSFEEKETGVRVTTAMLADVYQKKCDIAMLVSANSDLVPPIERIKELEPTHKIIVCFPPNRHSYNLQKWSNGVKNLTGRKLYEDCLLPIR
ncbi:MAG: NYN domain-containing protein [Prevotella sp.]|jgi:uncharacterized LabA/DUF88 family protein|nr:NYN domain-containing protein [Prevotella sp.]